MKKKVLITGASSPIGLAVAHQLAAEGYELVLHYRTNRPSLEGLPETIVTNFADFREQEDVDLLADRCRTLGVNAIVHCAAVRHSGNFATADEWRDVFAVNLLAFMALCKHLTPTMREMGWGRVVSITSQAANIGYPGVEAYSASKAGLEGFTRSHAASLKDSGATIAALDPGVMETGMGARLPERVRDKLLAASPQNDFTTPEEVAEAVSFMLGAGTNGKILHALDVPVE